MTENLILLTTPEHYPITPDEWPTITHAKLEDFRVEYIIGNEEVDTKCVEVQINKGFLKNSQYVKGLGYPGENYRFVDSDIYDFFKYLKDNTEATNEADWKAEIDKLVLEFIVSKGVISGTVIENTY